MLTSIDGWVGFINKMAFFYLSSLTFDYDIIKTLDLFKILT